MGVVGHRIAERLRLLGKTQDELARAIGMRQQGIGAIISGRVERPRKLREIARFTATTQEYLLGEVDDPTADHAPTPIHGLTRVPLISWVSAGRLADSQAEVNPEDAPSILVSGLGGGDFFALKVKGDSMDRVSPEDSTIIVNRSERQLIKGKPYVFAVRGQATYKLWHPSPLYLAPFSTNPINEPIFIDKRRDLEVIGRVRRTMLDL